MIDDRIRYFLGALARGNGRLSVLTGAGVSAESGIPTFRGPEGYWTVGSRNYHPQEMATREMFGRMPEEVWRWYLYRMRVCGRALPNPGHLALVAMERLLGERFTLITQNVDGLHLRAGNSPERTFMIHGNLFFMRCASACAPAIHPVPGALFHRNDADPLSEAESAALRCPYCGGWARPHVLWFDECYDEAHFKFESTLAAADNTALLLVVGTSGATNLPTQVVRRVHERGGTIVDVNIEKNAFTGLALSSRQGAFIQASAASALPEIQAAMASGGPLSPEI